MLGKGEHGASRGTPPLPVLRPLRYTCGNAAASAQTGSAARRPHPHPPAARPAQAVTSPKGRPACPCCSHTPRGSPPPEPQPLPCNMSHVRRACLRTPQLGHHPAWVTPAPVRLAVLAPAVVTPGGWVEWGQRLNHSRNFPPVSKVCLGGAGGVAWGGAPPESPVSGLEAWQLV